MQQKTINRVKRLFTGMEENIFKLHIRKGVTFRIYKEVSCNSTTQKQITQLKQVNDLNRRFSKEDGQ